MLNKNYNDFSKPNNRKLKNNNYRIIVFGRCRVGKSQFCNFVLRDKTNSVYRVSDSLENKSIDESFKSIKFTRAGVNFELKDTLGFDFEDREDYLQKYSKDLELKNIDYIILILSFQNRNFLSECQKFVENLNKIFKEDKLYNHFCIVFTHYYSFSKKMEKKKN